MTSQLAKEDLQDLRDAGLVPSDEDVIRLHALALRITDGPETTAWNAPRFAIAGGVVFWEPTLAAYYWHDFAKFLAQDTATAFWLFAFACANGRRHGYLESLRKKDDIELALGRFLGSCTATREEVERAIVYAVDGVEEPEPEPTELAKRRAEKRADEIPAERERRNAAWLERILTDAATSTGMTYADIMEQTPSRLCNMIMAANVKAGMKMSQTSASAHADYLATLAAIKKRLIAEKAEREGTAENGEQ